MTVISCFHGDDVSPSPQEEALFHVFPVPYEKSVTYGKGTAKGPQAILDASCQLELFDGKTIPAEQRIYTAPFLNCSGDESKILEELASEVSNTLSHGKLPVVIGGEHTITLGSILALGKEHDNFGVIQFDAHADLRDSYQGSKYNHACVMRRLHDKGIPFIQIGTRSYSYEEHLFRKQHDIPFLNAEDIYRLGINNFSLPDNFPDKFFITFDVDALDPAVMPATGTPVPGGLSWYQTMGLIEKTMQNRVCIGFDVVEFAPISHLHMASFTVAQLIYNIMGTITRSESNQEFHDFS